MRDHDLETREQAKVLAEEFRIPYTAALRVARAEMAAVPERLPRLGDGSEIDRRWEALHRAGGEEGMAVERHELLRTWCVDVLHGLQRLDAALPAMRDVIANGRALRLPDALVGDLWAAWPQYAAAVANAAARSRTGLAIADRALDSGTFDRLSTAQRVARDIAALVDVVALGDRLANLLCRAWLQHPEVRRGIGATAWALDTSQGSLSTVWHCSGYTEYCAQRLIGIRPEDKTDRWRLSPGMLMPDTDPADVLEFLDDTSRAHPPAWTAPVGHDVASALATQAARRRASARRRERRLR